MTDVRINTLGCRWDLDVSGVHREAADRIRRLWSRADREEADPSEPPGFPVVLRLGAADGTAEEPSTSIFRPGAEAATQPRAEPPQSLVIDGHRDRYAYALSSELTLRSISAQAGRLTLLHGAALSLPRSGASVVLVGRSGMGKTTATRSLGRHLGYLSDETAAIRDDLSLVAHPKPLSVVSADDHQGHKEEFSPDDLDLLAPPQRPWLAATVILDRDEAHTTPRLEPVGLLDAMIEVIPQSSSLPVQQDPLGGLARVLTHGRGTHRLLYAEIDDCTELVLDLLREASDGPGPQHWIAVPPPAASAGAVWTSFPGDPAIEPAAGARYGRAPWRDAIALDDEVLLLNGPVPVRLMGAGAAVWLRAATPATLTQLQSAAESGLGPHPDAEAIVSATVRELLRQGVLVAA